jgi:hypothetical protein
MLLLTMLTTGTRTLSKMSIPNRCNFNAKIHTYFIVHLSRVVRKLIPSSLSSSSSKRRQFLCKPLVDSIMVQRLALNDVVLLVIFEAFQQSVLEDIAQRQDAFEPVFRVDDDEAVDA